MYGHEGVPERVQYCLMPAFWKACCACSCLYSNILGIYINTHTYIYVGVGIWDHQFFLNVLNIFWFPYFICMPLVWLNPRTCTALHQSSSDEIICCWKNFFVQSVSVLCFIAYILVAITLQTHGCNQYCDVPTSVGMAWYTFYTICLSIVRISLFLDTSRVWSLTMCLFLENAKSHVRKDKAGAARHAGRPVFPAARPQQ